MAERDPRPHVVIVGGGFAGLYAARRLRDAAARWQLRGFTHYLHEDRDAGWLIGEDGRAFFAAARSATSASSFCLRVSSEEEGAVMGNPSDRPSMRMRLTSCEARSRRKEEPGRKS